METNGTLTAKKADAAPLPSLDDPGLYINREMSWLAFNRRVLEEALDPTVPLLERTKFLAIFAANFDEFFMVRVGGLQQKVSAGIEVGSGADRMVPRDQTEEQRQHLTNVFRREIFPVLTPLAIDPGHPFPHLLNKTLNLAVLLRRTRSQEELFALVQVPSLLARFEK